MVNHLWRLLKSRFILSNSIRILFLLLFVVSFSLEYIKLLESWISMCCNWRRRIILVFLSRRCKYHRGLLSYLTRFYKTSLSSLCLRKYIKNQNTTRTVVRGSGTTLPPVLWASEQSVSPQTCLDSEWRTNETQNLFISSLYSFQNNGGLGWLFV